MHTYIKISDSVYEVGSFDCGNYFRTMRTFNNERSAAEYVSYLNGGLSPTAAYGLQIMSNQT